MCIHTCEIISTHKCKERCGRKAGHASHFTITHNISTDITGTPISAEPWLGRDLPERTVLAVWRGRESVAGHPDTSSSRVQRSLWIPGPQPWLDDRANFLNVSYEVGKTGPLPNPLSLVTLKGSAAWPMAAAPGCLFPFRKGRKGGCLTSEPSLVKSCCLVMVL